MLPVLFNIFVTLRYEIRHRPTGSLRGTTMKETYLIYKKYNQ